MLVYSTLLQQIFQFQLSTRFSTYPAVHQLPPSYPGWPSFVCLMHSMAYLSPFLVLNHCKNIFNFYLFSNPWCLLPLLMWYQTYSLSIPSLLSFLVKPFVKQQVLEPHFRTDEIHWLCIFLLRESGRLLFIILLCVRSTPSQLYSFSFLFCQLGLHRLLS